MIAAATLPSNSLLKEKKGFDLDRNALRLRSKVPAPSLGYRTLP